MLWILRWAFISSRQFELIHASIKYIVKQWHHRALDENSSCSDLTSQFTYPDTECYSTLIKHFGRHWQVNNDQVTIVRNHRGSSTRFTYLHLPWSSGNTSLSCGYDWSQRWSNNVDSLVSGTDLDHYVIYHIVTFITCEVMNKRFTRH